MQAVKLNKANSPMHTILIEMQITQKQTSEARIGLLYYTNMDSAFIQQRQSHYSANKLALKNNHMCT